MRFLGKIQRQLMKLAIGISLLFVIVACQYYPTKQGQQYGEEKFVLPLNATQVDLPQPVNIKDYLKQVALIKEVSPSLYEKNKIIYQAIDKWIEQHLSSRSLNKTGLTLYQLSGTDNWGNVHLTGYYTPVLKARKSKTGKFNYPLYTKPINWTFAFPSREQIYQGALDNLNLEIAYTSSLIDNFIMEVQGSGYIDFEDNSPLVFLAYNGKNGHPYTSIGRRLIEQGEISKDKISMQAIKNWVEKQDEDTVIGLLSQNASTVFFKPQYHAPVVGSTGVPLIAKASVASDQSLIPAGSVLLVDVPLLDPHGVFTGQRELRLMVALDIGGAIKGQHLDMYQGIGNEAGEQAGFYNHYGRVWLLSSSPNSYLASPKLQ